VDAINLAEYLEERGAETDDDCLSQVAGRPGRMRNAVTMEPMTAYALPWMIWLTGSGS